jgi:Zinc-ribbon, C4HC2 type
MEPLDVGVHTLRLREIDEKRANVESLEEIRRICLHNAQVSNECGSVEKEEVWNLLADTVQNQEDEEGKLFNGWGGKGGGALGVEMVANFFQFYEAVGDVQMLATMYCVLNGGCDRIKADPRPNLLPHSRGYDNYIKRYAELLYSWDLLYVRAELNKHLPSNHPGRDLDSLSMDGRNENVNPRTPHSLGVGLFCPRCNDDVDPGTNACTRCRDWAFRCSICDNAVGGLFTFCDYCHHGGHLQHLVKWFSNNSNCPTGCGCQCTFNATSHPHETDLSRHNSTIAAPSF